MEILHTRYRYQYNKSRSSKYDKLEPTTKHINKLQQHHQQSVDTKEPTKQTNKQYGYTTILHCVTCTDFSFSVPMSENNIEVIVRSTLGSK